MSESIRLLIATDVHLGFAETDPVRRDDSTNTFEEILKIAIDRRVDALVLGGDLFHENRPSRKVYHKCAELLRRYCFSDKNVSISLEDDVSVNFNHSEFKFANFQDPLLRVGLPVFSIHGNHDDVASNGLCALDMLHAAGLLNYFGKHQSVEEITVSPLCIRKGSTCLALYGLGFIRDERLHRMFVNKKVHFDPPEESWFCVLMLHQNRARHGLTNYIPEQFLPDFMDLVVWGHEHPCLIDPEFREKFFIMQPGSTIATSLAEGEAGPKYVSLVKIRGKAFQAEKIELQTARQFYFADLDAEQIVPNEGAEVENKLQQACKEKVQSLLSEAAKGRSSAPESPRPELPLVRLRISCKADYPVFNAKRFGRHFENKIANPETAVLFVKGRTPRSDVQLDRSAMESAVAKQALERQVQIGELVKDYFKSAELSRQMSLLSENSLREALINYVQKYEAGCFSESVKQQFAKAAQLLQERGVHNAQQTRELLEKAKRSRVMLLQSSQEERNGTSGPPSQKVLANGQGSHSSVSTRVALPDAEFEISSSPEADPEQQQLQAQRTSMVSISKISSKKSGSEGITMSSIPSGEVELVPASYNSQESPHHAATYSRANAAEVVFDSDDDLLSDAAPIAPSLKKKLSLDILAGDSGPEADDFEMDCAQSRTLPSRATSGARRRRGPRRARSCRGGPAKADEHGRIEQQETYMAKISASSLRSSRGTARSRVRRRARGVISSLGLGLAAFGYGTAEADDEF